MLVEKKVEILQSLANFWRQGCSKATGKIWKEYRDIGYVVK